MIVFLFCLVLWWLFGYWYFGAIGLAWLIVSRMDNKKEIKSIKIEGTKQL